ncbi:rhomboid family intramembrane serine protease [Prochlorococcus sp. MIT 1300]|uniref:rhomboid family intramembrane serine protease n=1 Tax=Prochlorococcus sp. MIT 1300 TaxID=3096218 RepID=UPI002A754B77|nr:rhomboid family intramembrane serine protease [Prochlorococcus sp. MIT 1300]
MRSRLLIPFSLLSVAWIQEFVDQLFFAGKWNLPLIPRFSWWGLFTAPFSHADYGHLISNTLAFLPLSFLVLSRGFKDYIAVWIGVIIMEIPLWLFWTNSFHGLSGVIFGMVGYLLLIGILERSIRTLFLSTLCFCLFGNNLLSLIPFFSPSGVSWEGHFFGFLGGLGSAWIVRGRH